MKTFITEEMQLRQRAIEYAKKYNNNSKAVVKYHTTRQQIKRWRDRYDIKVKPAVVCIEKRARIN